MCIVLYPRAMFASNDRWADGRFWLYSSCHGTLFATLQEDGVLLCLILILMMTQFLSNTNVMTQFLSNTNVRPYFLPKSGHVNQFLSQAAILTQRRPFPRRGVVFIGACLYAACERQDVTCVWCNATGRTKPLYQN